MFFRKLAAWKKGDDALAFVRDLIDGDHEEDGEASMGGMSLVLPLLLLSYGNMDALRETLRAHLFVTHRNGQLYKAALRYAQLLAGLLQSHGIELASDRANVQKKLIHSALQDLAAFGTFPCSSQVILIDPIRRQSKDGRTPFLVIRRSFRFTRSSAWLPATEVIS